MHILHAFWYFFWEVDIENLWNNQGSSLVSDYFLFSPNQNVWFRGDIIEAFRCYLLLKISELKREITVRNHITIVAIRPGGFFYVDKVVFQITAGSLEFTSNRPKPTLLFLCANLIDKFISLFSIDKGLLKSNSHTNFICPI